MCTKPPHTVLVCLSHNPLVRTLKYISRFFTYSPESALYRSNSQHTSGMFLIIASTNLSMWWMGLVALVSVQVVFMCSQHFFVETNGFGFAVKVCPDICSFHMHA